MDLTRQNYLLKKICRTDHRAAFKALAELSKEHLPSILQDLDALKAKDDQQQFQLLVAKIVFGKGISGLTDEWFRLPFAEWRERLIGEIGLFLELWSEESVVDLFIHALDDPADLVSGRAVIGLREIIADVPRSFGVKSASGKARLVAIDKLGSYVTKDKCRKITSSIYRKIINHDNPLQLAWFDWHIELLGYTANKDDHEIIDMLKGFKNIAGNPFEVTHRMYYTDHLPTDNMAAEGHEIIGGTIQFSHTGLLDIHLLEKALIQIEKRSP